MGRFTREGSLYTTTQHNFRLTEMITERIFGIIALSFSTVHNAHTLSRVYWGSGIATLQISERLHDHYMLPSFLEIQDAKVC
jgi:hypothetical protein